MGRARLLVAVLLFVSVVVASAHAAAVPAPTSRPVAFEMALYLPAASADQAEAAARRIAAAEFKHFAVAAGLDPKLDASPARPTILIRRPPIEQYTPPDEQSLKYFGRGLSPEQTAELQRARSVLALRFVTPQPRDVLTVEQSNALMLKLSQTAGGFLWDEETREIFTADAWKQRRIDSSERGTPNVPAQITMHFYRPDDRAATARLITLGMAKFGCPDLVANELTRNDATASAALVNLACQTMVESGGPADGKPLRVDVARLRHRGYAKEIVDSYKEKATGLAELTLAPAKREEGDPANDLLELTFTNGSGNTIHARRGAIVSQVFGSHDEMVHVQHDAAIEKASAAARAKLATKKKFFDPGGGGLPVGDHLMVKGPFKTRDGGQEWMWVEVTGWKGEQISGVLANEPFDVPNLKAGDVVTVKQGEVFDYIHAHNDGTHEGNETAKLLEAKQQGERRVK